MLYRRDDAVTVFSLYHSGTKKLAKIANCFLKKRNCVMDFKHWSGLEEGA